jgi:hypothetical protein
MEKRFPHAVLALLCVSTAGCVGTTMDGPAPGDDPRVATFNAPDTVACPIDPDAYIGGDASLYECPDYWICEDLATGVKRCYTPGADFPDGGGDWDCYDEDGATVCRGSDFPDGGGGGDWDCERQGEFVVCRDDTPDYPDGGGGGDWDCFFSDEFRVCDSGGGGGDGGGGGGSGGGGGGSGDGGGGGGGGFDGVCETYYAVKFDTPETGSGACEDISGGSGVFCLDGAMTGVLNGCGMATVTPSGDDIILDLPDNCQLLEASSKCATTCEDASMSGSSGTFTPCGGFGISHIEAVWCCS